VRAVRRLLLPAALLVAGCLNALFVGACAKQASQAGNGSDPKAVAIADQVMEALGGKQKWDALAGLRWSFGSMLGDSVRSTRRHSWDKMTGRHRVEGVNRLGQHFTFIHTVGDTDTGMAWMDGTRIEGDSLHKLLVRANALWINDGYWFLMPYKLRDPGVKLAYAGDTTMTGKTYDRLALSFEHVGITPGDRYWVYVNRADHRVDHWEMVLQGDQPPPVGYTWEGWEQHDGLWFPTAHRRDSTNVFTNQVETVHAFAPGEFEKP
jgi:hypothetical protein